MATENPGSSPAHSAPPLLTFPDGLFGRTAELGVLQQAAALRQGCRLLILQGPAGIGKSTLLRALRRELRQGGGWCAIGACAGQPLPIPYSGLAAALADLARQLLAEPTDRLRPVQQRLRAALGSNGAALASLVPDFGPVFGVQPAPPPDDAGRQARLVAALRLVFEALADQGSSPVLGLDDLQWADRSSLEILRRLLLDSPGPNLLVVVTLRPQAEAAPAVQVTLAEIRRQRPDTIDLALAPLQPPAIMHLLRAAQAGEDRIDIEHSATALHAISQGNPLLLRQALYAAGGAVQWLRSSHGPRWVWNPQSADLPAGEQLRTLLTQRLQRMDAATLEILTAAACAGADINPRFLASLLAIDTATVAAALQHCTAAGLLIAAGSEEAQDGKAQVAAYRFVHAEVQRVVLDRLDERQLRRLHHRIGERLLRTTPPGARRETVFLIAGHLAAALHPSQDGAHAAEMGALFLEAARAALALSALHTAADYLQKALAWTAVVPGGWRVHYALHLEVHELAARVALYTGDYADLDRHRAIIFQMAQTPLDKAGVYKSCITAATLQGDYERALDLLHAALAEMGVRVPRRPGAWSVLAAYAKTRLALRRVGETALRTLPTTPTRAWWIIGDLVTSAYMAMQWSGQRLLMAWLSLQGVRWSVQHGHTPLSVIAYALYSVLLTNRFGDPISGLHFGRLAAELSERAENRHQRAGVLLTLNSLVVHQAEPIAATIEPLRQAARLALQEGDVRLATDCTLAYINHAQLAGAAVDALADELAALLAELEPYGETTALLVGRMQLQNLLNLAGASDTPHALTGSACNAEVVLGQLQQTDNRFGLSAFYSMTAALCLLFGRPREALRAAEQVRRLADSVGIGLFSEAVGVQVDALARLACYGGAGPGERRQLLGEIEQDIKQLRRWTAKSALNHSHRLHQVQAELARVQGRMAEAEGHYAAAWSLAVEQGFVHDEGGIAEQAARHYLHSEQWELAAGWRRRACDAYARWGSRAKLRYLDQTLPVLTGEPASSGEAAALPPAPATPEPGEPLVTPAQASGDRTGGDMQAALDDLRALSAYADPQQMITHLLSTLLARVQATRAVFLLRQGQRTLLYASLRAGQRTPDFPALALEDENAAHVPLAVIRLAVRQAQTVRATAEEAAGLAGRDPYFGVQGPSAVLCVPLAAHGHTVALLLLERAQDQTPPSPASSTAASAPMPAASAQAFAPASAAQSGFSMAEALYVELLGTRAALLVEISHLRRRLIDAAAPGSVDGPVLSAWLLGTLRVLHRGREVTPQLTGRVRDLVAFLLIQGALTPITRSEIAAIFWPDTGESQALTNVRNLLHKLRAAWPEAGDVLKITRHAVQWQAGVSIWVDVHEFERSVAEAGRLSSGAAIYLLRSSVALYAGDLLRGSGEEWLIPFQERLRERYLAALGRLADLLVEQHDFSGALHYAYQLAAAAPLREAPYRHLIRIHALAGDLTAATQAYDTCTAMLAREFGLPPSPATELIYRQFVGEQ